MECAICAKTPKQVGIGRHLHSGKWRHRGPQTKRLVKPNLQLWNGYMVCSRCLRTLGKQERKGEKVTVGAAK